MNLVQQGVILSPTGGVRVRTSYFGCRRVGFFVKNIGHQKPDEPIHPGLLQWEKARSCFEVFSPGRLDAFARVDGRMPLSG